MKCIFVTVFSCALIACNNQKAVVSNELDKRERKIVQASWLIGKWSNTGKQRHDYETWKKYNDSTYLGKSYSIENGDTVSSESIKLVEDSEGIYYIPVVQGQNNNLPVSFKLIVVDANKLVFENPAHEFPQRISYQLVSVDSLVAEISGMIKGEHRARQFPMRRME
ncbi:MAG TPA: DUF6265 family protein [Chryseolinea sp.]|nr:DUF6265 family protein [Chryseolinea sp.]